MRILPDEPVKTAVSAEIEARSEGMPQIFIADHNLAPEAEAVTESKPPKTEITTEEKTESAPAAYPTPHAVSKSAPASSKPKSGDRAEMDGKTYIWIPGFGWIVDEGGSSVRTTVGNPGDELTGNKVGIMGGAECPSSESTPSPSEQPELTDDVIYTELQPPITKNSTPPPYCSKG